MGFDEYLQLSATTKDLFKGRDLALAAESLQALRASDKERDVELDKQREQLRALSRQLETQKTAAHRPAAGDSPEQHLEKLANLDAERYTLGKSIADLEDQIASHEAKLTTTKTKCTEEDQVDLTESAPDGDPAELLRLKLYRDLGFVPIADENGYYQKMLVRSDNSKEVHVVDMNDPNSNGFHQANLLWNLLDS